MVGRDSARSLELTDPRALRALAHPTRLALVGLLRQEGPLTATRAGERLGESSGTCSFHLRQLAKYGLVEEAGGGRGREKPWRATAQSTSWPTAAAAPKSAVASHLLSRVIAEYYFERLMRWIEQSVHEPAEWQEAAGLGDTLLYLTGPELAKLREAVDGLIGKFAERTAQAKLRPAGARPFLVLRVAVPLDSPAQGPA